MADRHPPRNSAVRDALKRALTRAPSDLAHTMAERQRDNEHSTVRTSRDYDRFMADKGRRLAGAAVAIHGKRR